MKILLLTLIWIPLVGIAQSMIVNNDSGDLSLYKSTHSFFSNGDRIDVYVSSSSQGEILIRRFNFSDELIYIGDLNFSISSENIYPFDIIVYNDDSYTIGMVAINNLGTRSILLLHYSDGNNLIYGKRLNITEYNSPYNYHEFNHLSDDGQGGLYIQLSETEFYGLIHVNNFGDLLWSKIISGSDNSGKSPGFTCRADGEGGVYGTLKDGSYECLFNVNFDGNIIWSKTYIDNQYRWPNILTTLEDGNIVVAGTHHDFNFDKTPYVHLYSNVGDLLSSMRYEIDIQNASDLIEDQNGDLLFLFSDSVYNSYILKLNRIDLSIIDQITLPGIFSNYASEFYQIMNNYFYFNARTIYSNDHVNNVFDQSNPLCDTYLSNFVSNNDIEFQNAIINTENLGTGSLTITINDLTNLNPFIGDELINTDFCLTYSISEIQQEENFIIYPNPTNDLITIETDNNEVVRSISVIDLRGKVVLNQSFTEKPTKASIDLCQILPGSYLVGVQIGEEIIYRRIIKE